MEICKHKTYIVTELLWNLGLHVIMLLLSLAVSKLAVAASISFLFIFCFYRHIAAAAS